MVGTWTYSPSTNTITVTGGTVGAPAGFVDAWNADKAGTLTLKVATTPALNMTLTTQIKPTDEVALKIDFVLAGTSAGAGDTIDITGTDKDGGAQTETLDVSAGNGTYTTTKWYKTITDIDCNGFNDGTLTVNQGQWGCYDDKTEVLTENGWKKFKKLKKGEKVATLNPKTKEIEYHIPTRHFRYKVVTKMLLQDSPSVNLCVTNNHNMYVKKKDSRGSHNEFVFVRADKMPRHVEFKRDGVWIGQEQEFFVLPSVKMNGRWKASEKTVAERKIPMDDWLRFFGAYLSEGTVTKTNGYIIRAFQKDPEKAKLMFGYFQKIGNAHIWDDQGGKTFSLSDKQLYSYLSQFGKAKDKFVPAEIKVLSKRQLQIFFDALALGDGSYRDGRPVKYSSTSKRLSDDVQEILLKIGLAGTQFLDSSERFGDPCWQVSISSMKALTPHVNSETDSRKWIDYTGEVFCVEVPNHVIYVRREGKVCWCGNCVWKQATNQYAFDCKIVIGDGSTPTYFTDTSKEIIFNSGIVTGSQQDILQITASATATFGVLINAGGKTTKNGCHFIFLESVYNRAGICYLTGGNCYFYGCSFNAPTQYCYLYGPATNRVYESIFSNVGLAGQNSDFYRITISGITNAYRVGLEYPVSGTLSDVVVTDITGSNGGGVIFGYGVSTTIKNALFARCTAIGRCVTLTTNGYLINAVCDSWLFDWSSGGNTGKLYRQYEFDLAVTDKDGVAIPNATVTLKDKDGNTIFSVTTDANGNIATQTVSRGYYNQANGNTLQEYSPHTLTITKAGYITYTEIFTLTAKTAWTISLLDELSGTADTDDVITGETFYKNAYASKLMGTLALTGDAVEADVVTSKTFYNTDPKTQKTGTYIEPDTSGKTWGITKQDYDRIVKEEVEPYQMATAVLLLQRQRDKRVIKALNNE